LSQEGESRSHIPLPKRKINLKKSKMKVEPNKYTIYYQDNRETTVVSIINPEKTNSKETKSEFDTYRQMKDLKTPYFGEKRNGKNLAHSHSIKNVSKETAQNLNEKFSYVEK